MTSNIWKYRPRAAGWLLLLAAMLVLCPPSRAQEQPSPPPGALDGEGRRGYFSDLPVIDQHGREWRFFSDLLADKIVVITGFYVNCDTISPRQNLMLNRLQKKLGDRLGHEIRIVSVTVDPARDATAKVAEYARVFAPQPGWFFVTGEKRNIDWINYRLGQYLEDVEQHRGTIILGNVRTDLWLKASPDSKADDLYDRLNDLLADDPGDRP